ncbi:MAG TPA: cysteine--tRNA ligase [Gammaproteobacteria bacterium]|nr:cysteine--tRNA ligase [Gammaproteobacteria bacterium]
MPRRFDTGIVKVAVSGGFVNPVSLFVYNSLTGKKEQFKPIVPGQVGLYVCGVTVYDFCHIGHARVFVVFDVVVRHLRALGFKVNYVRNITDVDDKIIDRAGEQQRQVKDLTDEFIAAMHEDMGQLGVLLPDHEPRATAHMGQIIDMIERLQSAGYAYQASNGDVYYRVERFAGYGKLAGRDLQSLRAGARVEVNQQKENPLDFVLWKTAKPGEISWQSPWGEGRPGWHIECSAMSTHCLGDHFDIHGGGFDLQFPHHENEIAQSEAATGTTFVNTWMHNGFVRVDDEKMSKSMGNFFTIREVLQLYPAEVLRYFLLASHYRSELNFSNAALDQAWEALRRCYRALVDIPVCEAEAEHATFDRYLAAMNDDFNTPEALAVLFDLVRAINSSSGAEQQQLAAQLRKLGGYLGLLQEVPDQFLRRSSTAELSSEQLDDAAVQALVDQRLAAREEKNWTLADQLRDMLDEAGIMLEDREGKTRWSRR